MKQATIALTLLVCSLVAAAQQRSISGTVTNGTNHRPAVGDDVILLKLGQGMEEETRTKTDARGEFKLPVTDTNAMHLIRVRHDNVNYHEPAPPNVDRVQVTVYNSAAHVSGLTLMDQSEVYQATTTELRVIELFRINNSSAPAVTQPTFEFYLPEGASAKLAQAVSANGMPVTATVVPQQEKNRYAIMHPLRPGVTQLELVYTMPYGGKISLRPRLAMPADHFYVVTVQGMQFSGGGGASFQPTSPWPIDPNLTGIDVRVLNNVTPSQSFSFELSGTGEFPPQQAAAGQPQGGEPTEEDNRPGGGLGAPNEKPDPLRSSQWLFLAVLTLFLAAGATYVYTARPPAGAQEKRPVGSPLVMDAMKEEIFQLEAERLQGKISPQEYNSAKAALDKTLQRAVQREKHTDKAAGNS
ncbi:MAG TPA: hypothetical protein VIX19_06425 [Terriglobales bacterium]